MEEQSVERRLAAVVAADVVGYSRLMEVDEVGTLARLKTIRLELIDPTIAKCKGRIIKTNGDGMLVEFQSVTEAVRCAVEFQQSMARGEIAICRHRAVFCIELASILAM
jgi:adenylate cyclase